MGRWQADERRTHELSGKDKWEARQVPRPTWHLCPASAGAEVAGGVMWVVGSTHSWDSMGWQGHLASYWHQEMKEAAVGLPFPHSKVEKDYSREVAQGPHRHPVSSFSL